MTGTSFAIPVTSQERKVAAKIKIDQLSGLAREVKKGDGWIDGRCAITIPWLEFKFQIS